jgi:hypothetical protein
MKTKLPHVIFTPEEIQALHSGTMTHLRRPIASLEDKWDCNILRFDSLTESNGKLNAFFAPVESKMENPPKIGATCPFGRVGGLVWVKEAFSVAPTSGASFGDAMMGKDMTIKYKAGGEQRLLGSSVNAEGFHLDIGSEASNFPDEKYDRWQSAVSMPQWASRYTLKIENVKVQQLHDITEEEARAEGYKGSELLELDPDTNEMAPALTPLEDYSFSWNKQIANKNYPWVKNPYVWVIDFALVESLGFQPEAKI